MIRSNFFVEFAMVLGIVGTIGTLMIIGVEREKDKAPAEAPAPPPPPPAPAPLPTLHIQPLRFNRGDPFIYSAAIITIPEGQRFLYITSGNGVSVAPIQTPLPTVTKANP